MNIFYKLITGFIQENKPTKSHKEKKINTREY